MRGLTIEGEEKGKERKERFKKMQFYDIISFERFLII